MKLLYANDKAGAHAPSWYADTSDEEKKHREPLKGNNRSDVCVIGAGFTGLSAALTLGTHNVSCVVLDAHRVGWGASGRNGGQLGSGFNMSQIELEKLVGKISARDLWTISEAAKSWIQNTCNQYEIDINYQAGIVYAQHRHRFVKPLHEYCEKLSADYDYPHLEPLDASAIHAHVNNKDYKGGALDHGAAHIHPLKLARGLARAAETEGSLIHEMSEVVRIRKTSDGNHEVATTSGSVSCGTVIIACNGYQDKLNKTIGAHLMPINNFIVVTEPLGELANELLPFNEAVADSRFVVNYFRRVDDDRLLFGGGENYRYKFPENISPLVQRAMLKIFPLLNNVSIDYAWGGSLAITRNRLPFIRELSPGVLTAGGYSGHGVALATICGNALAEKILGNQDNFDVLSSLPMKKFPGGTASRSALLALAMTGYSWLDTI